MDAPAISASPTQTPAAPVVLQIPYCDPIAAFAPLRDQPGALLLHSCGENSASRLSFIYHDPIEAFQLHTAADLPRLQAFLDQDGAARRTSFIAGLLSYELGALFEPAMPQRAPQNLPYASLFRYGAQIGFDHGERRAFVAAYGPDASARAHIAAAALGAARDAQSAAFRPGFIEAVDSSAHYAANVADIIARIHAGDIYQANISRRFTGALHGNDHPFALFARLCRHSPAPFCAYLRLAHAAIVSNSPERLASATPFGEATALRVSPIKGTRPRRADPDEDSKMAHTLLSSEKDRAENLMIVDLMRNDLSRIARVGSVKVPRLFSVESFANVHHLVSTVEAIMRPDTTRADFLRALFPAGSITGAPKIKAMQLIESIEKAPREANYGALMHAGPDGAMDLSVLIRTATCVEAPDRWDVSFRVGAGIVADSDPYAEAEETNIKARALVRAVRGD